MLVLSRKLGEKILVGDSIVLTVVKIDHNQIRLGIEAPKDVLIMREELVLPSGEAVIEEPKPKPPKPPTRSPAR